MVSPDMTQSLMQRMDKYLFPADQVEVSDMSSRCALLTLVGPDSGNLLKELGGVSVREGVGWILYPFAVYSVNSRFDEH